jgi:uncharacterized protein
MTSGSGSPPGTTGQEWPATLDVSEWITRGGQLFPFQQFLIKLQGRCNLACSYCYVYEMADQTWRSRPSRMTPGLVSVLAARIAEHARAHNLDAVRVIFHGGEPLLAGPEPVVDALRKIRLAVDARVRVDSWLQTNGTLLTEKVLDTLAPLDIRVGVSIDGDAINHDSSRHYINGRGSHADVVHGLQLLMRRPHLYSGLLCVADLRTDPVATYETLLSYEPPMIDFLLPHGNWSSPPLGRPDSVSTPYADWLIKIFERWYGSPTRRTGIRLFQEIIHLLLGGASESEAVGITPTSLIVIETDGSIEQSDALKSSYHGAASTGLHIVRDSFDRALRHPAIVARQLGLDALSDECLACEVRRICGAGLYAHRYRKGSGFRNRSVYCQDLYALIEYIHARLSNDLLALRRSRSKCG